jgi:NAD(P)-dependent dehydrogenase (short-subunit alcohol dehydrogenase family)
MGDCLVGQVALVTGGGRGIGRAVAEALAAAGAAVMVTARSSDQLAETESCIEAAGGRVVALPTDVADPAAVAGLVAAAERRLGPIDLLVNNAGTSGTPGPLWEADPDEWWRCLEVNLRGPMLCARAVLPGMVARRRGRIVNVASSSATFAMPYLSAYFASKTALVRLTEVLALEAREHGVGVFALDPGSVRTAMSQASLGSPAGQRWLPGLADHPRIGPEPAARLCLRIAAGDADALSGRYISVHDDLDALIRRAQQVSEGDLYTLRLCT